MELLQLLTSPDPVFQSADGKWSFWDETWANTVGEYDTEEETRAELARYCLWLDGKLPEQRVSQVEMI